tara:strand:+ start:436 stop:558 length:123 start_codon:yes stop_codon:yes gene_type:complete
MLVVTRRRTWFDVDAGVIVTVIPDVVQALDVVEAELIELV